MPILCKHPPRIAGGCSLAEGFGLRASRTEARGTSRARGGWSRARGRLQRSQRIPANNLTEDADLVPGGREATWKFAGITGV
jgi:hypothetical protein